MPSRDFCNAFEYLLLVCLSRLAVNPVESSNLMYDFVEFGFPMINNISINGLELREYDVETGINRNIDDPIFLFKFYTQNIIHIGLSCTILAQCTSVAHRRTGFI